MNTKNQMTSSCNPIEITFFCVQPISIDESDYLKFINQDFDREYFLKTFRKKTASSQIWLNKFNEIYETFKYLIPIEIDIDKEKINSFLKSDLTFLGNFINFKETNFELLYDMKFNYFILIYNISFTFNNNDLEKILNLEKENLYTKIRNLVNIDKENNLSEWTKKIIEKSIKKSNDIISNITNSKNKKTKIENNTCNISVFIKEDETNFSLLNKFIDINTKAERLETNLALVVSNKNVKYYFNSRFHTIYHNNEKYFNRYAPIQFHIQHIWYLIKIFNKSIDKINIQIIDKKNRKFISKQNELIDELINKIKLLTMHDEKFQAEIEADNEQIYMKIEKNWHIQKNLKAISSYISFFKSFLDRKFSKQFIKSQNKQNKILFFLSIIQLIALISVWNDYLNLLDKDSIKNTNDILFLFNNNYNYLMIFNKIIPILLIIISVILIFFTF